MRKMYRLLSGVCLATGLLTPTVDAAFLNTTFTRSTWNSAVVINTTVDGLPNDWIDFDTGIECGNAGCAPSTSVRNYTSTMSFAGIPGFSIVGVYGGNNRLDHWAGDAPFGVQMGGPVVVTGRVEVQSNTTLQVNVPTTTTAFALDLATFDFINNATFNGIVTISVGTGSTAVDSRTINTAASGPVFFGATLDNPIEWIRVVIESPAPGFPRQGMIGATRISFGTFDAAPPPPPPTEMPEASTSLLVSAALIALRFLRRVV